MNPKNYTFDFTIPQGPTGPTGPSNGLNAYGGLYSTSEQTLNLNASVEMEIPLEGTLVAYGVNYDNDNTVVIQEMGIYEINYDFDVTSSNAADVTILVKVDNDDINPSEKEIQLNPNTLTTYNKSTIYPLEENDVVSMVIFSNTPTNVTIGNNSGFVIKRLD